MVRDFGSNVDRMTAKRLGQWATRLYIVLFVVGLVILGIYNTARPTTKTADFNVSSLDSYERLFQKYGNELKCPCSSIASKYELFVEIEAVFHNVCSSQFASDEGRSNLTAYLFSNLSIYAQKDYRRFLSAHLQFLQGLCQLSSQTVNISIQQFLSSLFVTAEVLSETNFNASVDSIIEQRKSNASRTFTRLLFLVRNTNHANAPISIYETNFEYIFPWSNLSNTYAPTKAMVYDDDCSCGSDPHCTTQASFISQDSKVIASIKGMKMGCTPSESFLASTLECFYNQSCISLILQYTNNTNRINSTNSLNALSITTSRFLINTTIDELINNLFIEEWKTKVNYTSYFEQCSPSSCSYTYIQQFNVLHIVSLLLGLQGGLAIVLQWICPKIVRIISKVYQYRKKRINTIHPVCSIETVPIENVNTNILKPTSDVELIPTNVTSQTNLVSPFRCSFKTILICILLLSIIAAVIIFSIHIAEKTKNQVVLTPGTATSTGTDSTTSITTSIIKSSITNIVMPTTTTIRSGCQLKFQPITALKSHRHIISEHAIADFNGDGHLDLAFISTIDSGIRVLLGNGNGVFAIEVTSLRHRFNFPGKISVADFDNDSKLDLVVITNEEERLVLVEVTGYVIVLLGNGDGTFKTKTTVPMVTNHRLVAVAVADFNGDRCLDIATTFDTLNYISILLGKCNGDISKHWEGSTGFNSDSLDIAVADFNRDGFQDIAVVNHGSQNIGIFLGHGNGYFTGQKTSSTGGHQKPTYLAVEDFNSDTLPDIAVAYQDRNYINVMFGDGNGTVGNMRKFDTGDTSVDNPIVVRDFNGDRVLDIGFGRTNHGINVLLGYGNGNFELQTAITVTSYSKYAWIDIGDFNGDGYIDMIHVESVNRTYHTFLNKCK